MVDLTPATPILPSGLCADIGGSFVKFAPAQPQGEIGPVAQHPTPTRDWEAFCRLLRACCGDVAADVPLSLSIAGYIPPNSGLVRSANIPCIDGRPLAADLRTALGRPVRVANDADCFVLAEALRGVGQGAAVVFGIVMGTGIGGGLVVEGRLIPGAGEWGHGPVLGARRLAGVDVPALRCGCGQRGCLDTLAGARGLERLDALLHGGSRSSTALLGAWRNRDTSAAATVEAWLDLVAGPLALVVHATGAGVVPVAGGLGSDHALVEALDIAVRGKMIIRPEIPLVLPARLGATAGLVGAALRLVAEA